MICRVICSHVVFKFILWNKVSQNSGPSTILILIYPDGMSSKISLLYNGSCVVVLPRARSRRHRSSRGWCQRTTAAGSLQRSMVLKGVGLLGQSKRWGTSSGRGEVTVGAQVIGVIVDSAFQRIFSFMERYALLCSPCPSVRLSVCLSVRDFTFSSTRKCAFCHSLQWVLSYIFQLFRSIQWPERSCASVRLADLWSVCSDLSIAGSGGGQPLSSTGGWYESMAARAAL
jgi:hypothetical protein